MNGVNVWRWILDLGWLIVLFALLIHFWRARQILVQAQAWLKVKGHIIACEWTTIGHSIWPKIEYAYQVYDKEIIGQHLFLDTTHNNPNSKYARQVAYKVAVAFKENEEIEVFYNPNHPEQSALDVTIPKKLTVILVLISLLIISHVILVFWRLLG
jgi:hypothetical protein